MRETTLPPSAPALLESLRAVGYSFEAAVSDVVDNSLSAHASRISIQFRTQPDVYLAILDNGVGMSALTLEEAMRHGGLGPAGEREPADLGRFGLGLKTASLSQCRQLTVVSMHANALAGAEWSLDRVEATGDWTLGLLDPSDIEEVPHLNWLREAGAGTIVLWRDFDRALAGATNREGEFGDLVAKAREHLSLVFHRFLQPEAPRYPTIEIDINGNSVRPTDPMLIDRSVRLPDHRVRVEDAFIDFTPYVLPHRSRMTRAELVQVDGVDGLRRSQGFYVYRARRLITSGTWFRLRAQDEMTKLARVRVDIPNKLDHLWQVDIKKSTATPPQQVREGVRQVLNSIGQTSKEVIRHRGWKGRASGGRLWQRLENPNGVTYVVNRDHPALTALTAGVAERERVDLERLLKALEMTIPFQEIYVDVAAEREVSPSFPSDEVEEELRELLGRLLMASAQAGGKEAKSRTEQAVRSMEPFNRYPELTKRLLTEVEG